MDRRGLIHDKLDIKILILFVLKNLPEAVNGDTLARLVLFDEGINYFDYIECIFELIDTGHIDEKDGKYKITEKGRRNGSAIESSLPYSIRARAERLFLSVAVKMRRNAMIETDHEELQNGSCKVTLKLSDGVGPILEMSLLAPSPGQAARMEKNFRLSAEKVYTRIIELLTED